MGAEEVIQHLLLLEQQFQQQSQQQLHGPVVVATGERARHMGLSLALSALSLARPFHLSRPPIHPFINLHLSTHIPGFGGGGLFGTSHHANGHSHGHGSNSSSGEMGAGGLGMVLTPPSAISEEGREGMSSSFDETGASSFAELE
jgi:hypothetical protein